MLEKAVRRMKAALTGVQPLEQWLDPEATRKLHTVTRPPTYLVRIALELVFGYRLPRPHEKSAWGAVVSFKGEIFEIVDWRRYEWSISGRTGAEATATQLLNKLKAAARVLDGQLKEECQTLREAEEFSLDNQFQRYQTLFSLFREECLSWMEKEIGRAVLTRSHIKSIGSLLEAFSEESGTRASRVHAYLLAATVFFFSLTEVILDCCFALGDRKGKTFRDFHKPTSDWAERFKLVVPMEERAAQELFQSLLEIRKRYRNESVHSSPLYLFAIKGVGLIPATDADLDKPSLVKPWCAKTEDARDVLEILDRAMRHLETSEATRFGFAFAKTGLAIPIAEQRLARHREAMTSMGSFRLFLDRLVEHADAVANMDV